MNIPLPLSSTEKVDELVEWLLYYSFFSIDGYLNSTVKPFFDFHING